MLTEQRYDIILKLDKLEKCDSYGTERFTGYIGIYCAAGYYGIT